MVGNMRWLKDPTYMLLNHILQIILLVQSLISIQNLQISMSKTMHIL